MSPRSGSVHTAKSINGIFAIKDELRTGLLELLLRSHHKPRRERDPCEWAGISSRPFRNKVYLCKRTYRPSHAEGVEETLPNEAEDIQALPT